MEFKKFKHKGVLIDGSFKKEKGSVETKGCVRIFRGEGCGLEGCHCSDGYSISICMPRTEKGIVEGMNVRFANKKEMERFI